MPKVSIVIPTRNRPHLLKYALASALGQTFQDIEVVVSDNYCGNEKTRKIYDSFDSPKLRYVRTNELLSMPDSWEFALGHARGEYITYLTDDTYLFSDAIQTAVEQVERFGLEIAVWRHGSYFAPDWMEPDRRNLLYIPRPSFSSRIMPSHQALIRLFDLEKEPYQLPRFLNSLCHRKVVERVVGAQKRVFFSPCPDYAAALGLLVNVKRYLQLDWPLLIDGLTPTTIGASQRFNWGQAADEFMKEFKGSLNFVDKLGLDIPTITLIVALSIENVKEIYHDPLPYEINKEGLIRGIVRDLIVNESNGTDMSEAWRALEDYLMKQPDEVRKAAAKQRRRSRLVMILKKLRHIPFWEYLERFRGYYVFHGSRLGFNNIEECGKVAERLVRKLPGWNRVRLRTEKIAGLA